MDRMTRQRRAILECFETGQEPLSIEEIEKEVMKTVAGISLSTLYRNLKVLLAMKVIQLIQIPGQIEPRYEKVKGSHSHHFLCIHCDRLYEIVGCPEGILAMVPEGFKMLEHLITLKGVCKRCLRQTVM